MKSIELTEKQKDKLLEMCRVLFPELDICLTGQSGRAWDAENECFINIYNNITDDVLIHWFEFCLVYLITRLQQNLPEELVFREQPPFVGNVYGWKKGNKWTLYSEFFFHYPKNLNKENPIDYLYKEFKKLKNEKI